MTVILTDVDLRALLDTHAPWSENHISDSMGRSLRITVNAVRPIVEELLLHRQGNDKLRAMAGSSRAAMVGAYEQRDREYEAGLARCTMLTEQSLRLREERDRYRDALAEAVGLMRYMRELWPPKGAIYTAAKAGEVAANRETVDSFLAKHATEPSTPPS